MIVAIRTIANDSEQSACNSRACIFATWFLLARSLLRRLRESCDSSGDLKTESLTKSDFIRYDGPRSCQGSRVTAASECFWPMCSGRILYVFPQSNRRGVELFFADRATGTAEVSIWNGFEEDSIGNTNLCLRSPREDQYSGNHATARRRVLPSSSGRNMLNTVPR